MFVLLGFTSSAHAIINGTAMGDSPDLVRLVFKNGNVCSGVYIDSTTILTAAHCLGRTPKDRIDKILSLKDEPLAVEEFESVRHPQYEPASWPNHDIGVIRTSKNEKFAHHFKLEEGWVPFFGMANFFGCGMTDVDTGARGRTGGENFFFRIGPFIFAIGDSKPDAANEGKNVSVSLNDSGGPIVRQSTGKIIGVATKTTIEESASRGWPAISIGTSVDTRLNRAFLMENMEKQGSTL